MTTTDELVSVLFPSGVPAGAPIALIVTHLSKAVAAAKGWTRKSEAVEDAEDWKTGAANQSFRRSVSESLADREAHPFGLLPSRTIAMVVGCDHGTVCRWMKRHGISGPRKAVAAHNRWKKLLDEWEPERIDAWLRDHSAGPGARAVARELKLVRRARK